MWYSKGFYIYIYIYTSVWELLIWCVVCNTFLCFNFSLEVTFTLYLHGYNYFYFPFSSSFWWYSCLILKKKIVSLISWKKRFPSGMEMNTSWLPSHHLDLTALIECTCRQPGLGISFLWFEAVTQFVENASTKDLEIGEFHKHAKIGI